MDTRGLIAVIVTFHAVGLALAAVVGCGVAVIALLVVRPKSTARRLGFAGGMALASALLAYSVVAKLSGTRAISVETVRPGE